MRARILIPLVALAAGVIFVMDPRGWFSGDDAAVNVAPVPSLVVGETYRVDDAFVESVGEDIQARFTIKLPKRRGETHLIGREQVPEGGIVQFNFRTAEGDFMESLFVAPVDVPLDDAAARLAFAGSELAKNAPAVLSRSFDGVAVDGDPRQIEIGGLPAMELTGTYRLRDTGAPYAWRFVLLPHPDRAASLYTVGHVSLDHHPVEGPDDHRSTLSGKALSTLQLTDLAVAE